MYQWLSVCGVHFSVVSERVPDAPPDTEQMRDTDLQSTVVENASDSDDKAAQAANSGREDSWLTRRTDQATPGKGRHERSMWNPLRVDEKNGAADTKREDSWLARQADPGTPNEDELVDGGPLTRPPNGYVESKDGLQVVDAGVRRARRQGRGRVHRTRSA